MNKILFVLTYYRPHWTGLTKYAARLAEGLAKRGHKIEVVTSQQQRNLKTLEEIRGVKVYRVPYWFRWSRSVIMPGFLIRCWQRMGQNEVVVAYLPLQEVLAVALMCKILRKKLFLVHNGDLVLPKGIINRLMEAVYFWATSWAISLADGVIIQTKDYAKNSKLLKRHKNKWRVVMPLLDIPTRIEPKYKIKGKKLIGFSGRFVEEKGVDYLLRAVPTVVEKEPRAYFLLAGDYKIKYEKYWEKIRRLVDRRYVKLLGLLDEEDIFRLYKSLDVYVQPSRSDCFPSSQNEALMMGVPSVCTDIAGGRWVVKASGMGVVVKPENLAEGILVVLKNRQKYVNNKIKSIFDDEKTLDAYEKLFG